MHARQEQPEGQRGGRGREYVHTNAHKCSQKESKPVLPESCVVISMLISHFGTRHKPGAARATVTIPNGTKEQQPSGACGARATSKPLRRNRFKCYLVKIFGPGCLDKERTPNRNITLSLYASMGVFLTPLP